jgi:hypothetical protein
MEEIFNDKPETTKTTAVLPEKTKRNWKVWLATDEAIRWVYLIFGLFAIILLMVLCSFRRRRFAAAIGTVITISNGVRCFGKTLNKGAGFPNSNGFL